MAAPVGFVCLRAEGSNNYVDVSAIMFQFRGQFANLMALRTLRLFLAEYYMRDYFALK